MAEIEVAFAPTKLGARRRRLPPAIVGVTIVGLLGLAIAKPWSTGVGPTASAAVRPSPGGSPLAVVNASSGIDPSPPATTVPILYPGPPRPGAWGISVGLDASGETTGAWVTWTEWVPLDAVSEGSGPPVRVPPSTDTGCSSVPTLAGAPTLLGITVPEATSTDFSVVGWLSDGPWTESLDGQLTRLDVPGRDQVATLASRDGRTFPDGRYELQLLTSDQVIGLGFCIDSSRTPGSAATGLDQAITAQIVTQLAARSGAWGVGTGGNGPRLVREEPWTDWVPVDPGTAWDGTSLNPWPDTGLCVAASRLLSHPALVAVTVPVGLVPDWRVAAWWTDGAQPAPLARVIRQISPPGNRGISYLERVDRTPWPDGRYEFDIQAGDHRASLTACIGAH